MKKLAVLFISLFSLLPSVLAETVTVNLFHWDSCPHCQEEIAFLNTINDEDVIIKKYEVVRQSDKYELVKEKMEIEESGVPLTIIGNDYIVGYSDEIKEQIKETIEAYKKYEHEDIVGLILKNKNIEEAQKLNKDILSNYIKDKSENHKVKKDNIKKINFLGKTIKFNPKKVSLPLISLLIGFIDGFNPCAMWVLIFLISLLIGMENKKRMWALGITFLATSALVYLGFMVGLLSVTNLLIGTWFKYILASVALIGGGYNLYKYISEAKKDVGCTVTNKKQRNKIISKVQKIIKEKNFLLALIGIILLAVSVNFIELLCSSGLPTVFISVLSVNDLNNFEYALYLGLYILMFMIDDIIVFVIAMLTLKVTGITNKYTKYSHLIGGILMLLIGILMIFKMDWLMFNF